MHIIHMTLIIHLITDAVFPIVPLPDASFPSRLADRRYVFHLRQGTRKTTFYQTPTQTEIVLKSNNKQQLGQAAANIRGFRPPEPYKGKGIRYSDEHVIRKEAKKK